MKPSGDGRSNQSINQSHQRYSRFVSRRPSTCAVFSAGVSLSSGQISLMRFARAAGSLIGVVNFPSMKSVPMPVNGKWLILLQIPKPRDKVIRAILAICFQSGNDSI